ncbi:hypothetical protein KP77_09920 [Jeotgalibacillus alimentarius]|uniref:Transcriptional regulator n=1 Tax=Jeotgalibacillus alimentarius TaxID=135826 RepID=A0A0C2RML3_9BACL|nr:hypothetical protein KP77_09920 [Jeotgalibacillus alimentarius]
MSQFKKLDEAEVLYQEGLKKISQPATVKVWEAIFEQPITNAEQLKKIIGLPPSIVRKAIRQLTDLNMIFGDDRQRNRRYYQYDLIRVMNS